MSEKFWGAGASRRSEETKADKKAAIILGVKKAIAEERSKDPDFKPTQGFIKKIAETRRDLFPNHRTYTSIMNFFSNDFAFLLEQTGETK